MAGLGEWMDGPYGLFYGMDASVLGTLKLGRAEDEVAR